MIKFQVFLCRRHVQWPHIFLEKCKTRVNCSKASLPQEFFKIKNIIRQVACYTYVYHSGQMVQLLFCFNAVQLCFHGMHSNSANPLFCHSDIYCVISHLFCKNCNKTFIKLTLQLKDAYWFLFCIYKYLRLV